MFYQLIIGIDGSDLSKNAVRVGADLAQHYSSAVTLVHVPHAETAAFVVGAVAGYHAATTMPSFDDIEEAGQKVLSEAMAIAAEAGLKEVKTHMPHGDAGAEILKHADDIGADLIITGRRGLSGISSLVLGSTTQRINHLAKCATLSIV